MENIWLYLLKMFTCSGILYAYYRLALYNERFHQWNRFYLLGALVLSLVVPMLNIPLAVATTARPLKAVVAVMPWNTYTPVASPALSWQQAAGYLWALVALVLTIKMLVGIVRIIRLYSRHQSVSMQHHVQLLVTTVRDAPFSFFNWLFWRRDIDPGSDNGQRILNHELTHIREKHSLDKLFCVLVLCLFWMNPFFWLIRKELNMIHEFLADSKAVDQQDGSAFAQMILLGVYPGSGLKNNLINPFFSSNIKRRLRMITTSDTPTYSYLRRISGLVIMTVSFVVLAFTLQVASAQQAATPKVRAQTKKEISDTTKPSKKVIIQELNTGDKTFITFDSISMQKNGNLNGSGIMVTGKNVKGKVSSAVSTVSISAQNVQIVEGTNPPLYIVDGKEVTPALTRALDPNKIASVDVLKGENAVAKYGRQAENGVVIIHLKSDLPIDDAGKNITMQTQSGKIPVTALIVVDGRVITSEEMNNISPDRIATINVLKGEMAKAQYGDKGKEGVIEIVLKKGAEVKNL